MKWEKKTLALKSSFKSLKLTFSFSKLFFQNGGDVGRFILSLKFATFLLAYLAGGKSVPFSMKYASQLHIVNLQSDDTIN